MLRQFAKVQGQPTGVGVNSPHSLYAGWCVCECVCAHDVPALHRESLIANCNYIMAN